MRRVRSFTFYICLQSQYVYTPLKDANLDAQNDHYNFFGIIIDAGFPYRTNQGKYICTLKVVDHTLHHRGGTDTLAPIYATVIIYAKRQEDLPVVSNVGDIIRIHRATMKQFHDQKQFHVNVYYNSSWCLFKLKTSTQEDDDLDYQSEEDLINVNDQDM